MSAPTRDRQEPTAGHVRAEDFRHRANCSDVDPEIFFPAADRGPEHEAQVAAAKAVCGACRVRAECLAWALAALPYGIAGAMTEDERRQVRARRRGARRRCWALLRPEGGTQSEVAAAGREAIGAGRDLRGVAREFGVTDRTALRWAAQIRTEGTTASSTGEGSAGGHRAPLQISHTATQAGTRAEGTRG